MSRRMNRHAKQIAGPDGRVEHRECDPTYNLDNQIARARREMGEERWAQLQAEWNA